MTLACLIPVAFVCFARRYVGQVITVRSVDFYPLVDLAQSFDAGSLETWVNGMYPIGYALLLRLGLAAGLDVVQVGHGLSVAGGMLMLLSTYLLAYRLIDNHWLALLAEAFLGTTGYFLYFATMEGNDMLTAGLQWHVRGTRPLCHGVERCADGHLCDRSFLDQPNGLHATLVEHDAIIPDRP